MTTGAPAKEPLLNAEFLRRLERLALMARKVQLGASKGERRSKRKGSSSEFADYREYVQGDDLRHVDWNIYGRLDAMHLKLFQEQEDLTLHLVLDGSRSMAFGSPPKFDFARKLAAALGYIGLTGYDRVVGETFVGGTGARLTPLRGKAMVQKLFGYMEGLEADGVSSLYDSCRAYSLRNRTKGMLLFISDLFDDGGYEDALKHLMSVAPDLYVVQVLAPEELDPKLSGDLKLIDSETNAFAEISVSRALLKRYNENRDAFLGGAREFCHRRGIGHFVVPSNAPIEDIALQVLRKGGMLR